ncbi:MAG: preprotein translocase subunit YajC [Oscillospiraceae bacterium]|nr:preprotein translocase subunit YajC [Oscillospiraceae bacterium]
MNSTLALISTASASAGEQAGASIGSLLTMIIPLALIIVFFYFFIIRPEKKRNKEMQNMLNSIQVADEVITNGGIIGRVLSVKEDTVLIETGSDRTKIRVLKTAIAKNNTVHEAPAEPAPVKKKKGKDDKPAEIK